MQNISTCIVPTYSRKSTVAATTTTTYNSTMASLVPGAVYRVRYGTKTSSSTQKKGERKIRVLEGPHTDDGYKHGPVVCVRDLTDPKGPTEKVFYVDRFVSVKLVRPTSDRHQRRDDRACSKLLAKTRIQSQCT